MPKKTVILNSHGYISKYPQARVYWDDTYIRFKTGHGRIHYYAPTLISRSDFENNHEFNLKFYEEHPEFANDPEDGLLSAVAEYELIRYTLDQGKIYVEKDHPYRTPDIITPSAYIDQKEAERMIAAFMDLLGYKDCRFKWRKQDLFIGAVSIGPNHIEEGE
jgi:hypothetical protein